MQKVPIAVSVATAQTLENHQITSAYSLPTITPSLKVESRFGVSGATNFSVRGIGTAIFGPQVESSVGIVIDDVAMGRPVFGSIDFFDLDRVEVLRGPQGMLFGKNAAAGLVNILTTAPRIGKTEFLGSVQYGNADTATAGNQLLVQSAVNLPVSANSAMRASLFVKREDGFVKNVNRSEDLGFTSFGGRLKYLWESGTGFNVLLNGDYVHGDGPGAQVLVRSFDAPGGFIANADRADGVTASPRNLSISAGAPTSNKYDTGGGSAKLTYEFDNGMSITNVTAIRRFVALNQADTDSVSLNVVDVGRNKLNYRQLSNELRIALPQGNRLSGQVGFYYLDLTARETGLQAGNLGGIIPAPPGLSGNLVGSSFDARSQTYSYAAFAEGQLRILDNLRLTAGGRFTHDDSRFNFDYTKDPGSLLPLVPDSTIRSAFGKDNFSYRVGLDYNFTPDILAYATYSRGYKSPTFDGQTGRVVREEIPQSIEAGLKTTLLDRHLRLNVTAFDTTFDGFQTQVALGTLGFQTLNAGRLKARGVEVESTVLPFEGLSIATAATYLDSKYSGLSGVPCYNGQPTGIGPNLCDTTTNPALPTSSASGNALQNASRWTVTSTVRYERRVSGTMNAFIQGDMAYRSSFNYTQLRNPYTQIDGYAVFGLSAGASTDDGRETLTFFVRNLTNKRVPTLVLQDALNGFYGAAAPAVGNYWSNYGPTSFRTIGVSFSIRR